MDDSAAASVTRHATFDWILCFPLLFILQGALGAQEFAAVPAPTEVNPGDGARLACEVRDRRGECVWLRDGRVVGRIADKYDFQRDPTDGDCSIHVTGAKLEEDDGLWQCQVTQTSVTEPTLTSPEVRLTVREAPLPPRLEDNTIQIPAGESLRTRAGDARRLHCVSRRGNPPARLRWYVGSEDVTNRAANQSNTTDPDKPKTWIATSVLNFTFEKIQNGQQLRCVAVHAAYDTGSREIAVNLEVLYPPVIRLEGGPTEDIEEGRSLSLHCVADSNPQANIIWRKSGQSGIYDIKDRLDFSPIRRADSGTYSCSAKNDVGQSEELAVTVDVKYKPKILRVIPSPITTVPLYDPITLKCEAEGNPVPSYTWLQKTEEEGAVWRARSHNSSLHIANVTYLFQGKYVCEVSNVINGARFKATSQEITLDVTGAPQVLAERSKTRDKVQVEKDEDASIVIYFCSDPRPQKSYWSWGDTRLESGSDMVRYVAEPLLPDPSHPDCFEARLIVQRVEGRDSGRYTLVIENEKGRETFSVPLHVREPVAMSIVIGIIGGCILLLLILVIVVIYLLRSEKLCFSRKKGFKPDSDSGCQDADRLATEYNGRAIPPDALYATPKSTLVIIPAHDNYRHYENLKHPQHHNLHDHHHHKECHDPPPPLEGLVYADLNLPRVEQNGAFHPHRRQNPTEYAEIQFQPVHM